jgi:DNA-binding transcriptional ArsR family regulator
VEEVTSLTRLDALQVIAHPLRVRILEELREPTSAATVARRLGEVRQKINYHLKELWKVGLVRPVGERRSGNFIETLYEAVARSFVISPRVVWADPRKVAALREQFSLEQLILTGEQIQRAAAVLLDRAAFDGQTVASASVTAEVSFASEEERAAFLKAYLAAVGPLLKEYGSSSGERYKVVLAAYPEPGEGTSQ